MTLYVLDFAADGSVACTVRDRDGIRPLSRVMQTSASGFHLGGDGAVDLAVSILTDLLGDQRAAWEYRLPFMWAFISVVRELPASIPGHKVTTWLAMQRSELCGAPPKRNPNELPFGEAKGE